jgi:hypothetical protein
VSENALQSVPVLDVAATLELARCACGGHPKRFQSEVGVFYVCGLKCNKPGSGVYRDQEDARRAWNRVQEKAGK